MTLMEHFLCDLNRSFVVQFLNIREYSASCLAAQVDSHHASILG